MKAAGIRESSLLEDIHGKDCELCSHRAQIEQLKIEHELHQKRVEEEIEANRKESLKEIDKITKELSSSNRKLQMAERKTLKK